MHLNIGFFDLFIILLYFSMILWLGLRRGRKIDADNDVDYLLGGRRLTTPLFVFTLVGTWYGGILGVGEFTFLYGLSNWLVFAFPYYIFALIFAIFLAEKLHKKEVISIPELISRHYGGKSGILAAFFISVLISPAPYLLIFAVLFSFILPGSTFTWALLSTVFSIFYLRRKGFQTVILTDIFQFFLMFISFAILLFSLIMKYPIAETFSLNLPAAHLSLNGGLPALTVLAWFFIALWTLIDPGFHQRVSAARSPKIAKNGILTSILFWFIFDSLTLLTALYARALLPDLDNPLHTYPAIAAKMLPAGLLGLFFTGLIATVMSTLDSYYFLSVQTLRYDLFRPLFKTLKPKAATNIAYLLVALSSLLLIWLLPSVIDLWFTIGTLIIPSLLLPVLTALYPIALPRAYFYSSSLLSFIVTVGWKIAGLLDLGYVFSSVEAFYPGMLTSLVIAIYFYRHKKNRSKLS